MTASAKKSKRFRYYVANEFLRFWFRYLESNRSSIEEALAIVYENTIEPDLPNHVGETFEDICQEAIWERIRRKEFLEYSEIDRWWYGENKIDIVGLSPTDDTILFAECKFTPIGATPIITRYVSNVWREAGHFRPNGEQTLVVEPAPRLPAQSRRTGPSRVRLFVSMSRSSPSRVGNPQVASALD